MEYDFRTDIVLIADDFYDAYKRCREGKNPVHIGNRVKFSAFHIPAIVNIKPSTWIAGISLV